MISPAPRKFSEHCPAGVRRSAFGIPRRAVVASRCGVGALSDEPKAPPIGRAAQWPAQRPTERGQLVASGIGVPDEAGLGQLRQPLIQHAGRHVVALRLEAPGSQRAVAQFPQEAQRPAATQQVECRHQGALRRPAAARSHHAVRLVPRHQLHGEERPRPARTVGRHLRLGRRAVTPGRLGSPSAGGGVGGRVHRPG